MIQLDPGQQRRAEALQKRIEAEKLAAQPTVKPTPPMDASDMRMVSEDLARAQQGAVTTVDLSPPVVIRRNALDALAAERDRYKAFAEKLARQLADAGLLADLNP